MKVAATIKLTNPVKVITLGASHDGSNLSTFYDDLVW